MVSGYACEVKSGFVTFSLNSRDLRHSYEMVKQNTDCKQCNVLIEILPEVVLAEVLRHCKGLWIFVWAMLSGCHGG